MEDREQDSAEFTSPIFSAKLKGRDIQLRDILLLLIAICTPLTGYMVWEHKGDGKHTQQEFVLAVKDMAQAQREQNQIAREQTCLLRFGQERRENVAEYCRQISR